MNGIGANEIPKFKHHFIGNIIPIKTSKGPPFMIRRKTRSTND